MPSLGPMEIVLIILVIAIVFGWSKLPDAARSLGRSMRIFKSEVEEMKRDKPSTASRETVPGTTVPPQQAYVAPTTAPDGTPVYQAPVQNPAPAAYQPPASGQPQQAPYVPPQAPQYQPPVAQPVVPVDPATPTAPTGATAPQPPIPPTTN